jgi:hypothetical protein
MKPNKSEIIPQARYLNAKLNKYILYKENKNKCGVYRWTNLVNGNSYIGSSTSLYNRFRVYFSLGCLNNVRTGSNIIPKDIISSKSNFSTTPSFSSNSLDIETINENKEINNLILYNNGVNNKENFDLFIFNYIVNIIKNNPINKDTQLLIERFLSEQGNIYTMNKENPLVLNIDINKFTGKFNEYCINKIDELKVYFEKLNNSLNSNEKLIQDDKPLNDNEFIEYYIKEVINTIDSNDAINTMYYTLFKIVSYNDIVDINDDDNNYTNTSVLQNNLFIGKNLVNIYI